MDHFLYHHRSKIDPRLIGNENEMLLFPGFNKNTNVDDWPLCLFHFLIMNIIQSELIPDEIKELVRQLQQKRRELYPYIVAGINERYFEEHAGNIRTLVNRICELIPNSDLKYSTDQEFTKTLEHTETHNRTDYIQEFNINHETEKSFRKIITEFTPEQHRLHDFLEQNVKTLEVCQRNDPIVSIREDDHMRDLEVAAEQGHDLTQSYLPPRTETSKYPVTLPEEVIVEIQVSGCATGQRSLISERIVSSFNASNITDTTERKIQNVYRNTFSSYGEILARRGCIQIVVRPRTAACLFQLFNDCVEGLLTKRLRPAQDLIRKVPGFEQYEQEAVLLKDNYDIVMDKLVMQVMQQLEGRTQTLEPKHRFVAETSDEGNVLLHIKGCSAEELAAFKYAVRSGRLQPTLNVLQTTVQSISPNVLLHGRIKYKTDPNGAGAFTTEESTSEASKRLCEVENSCKEVPSDTPYDWKSNNILDQSSFPGKETSDTKKSVEKYKSVFSTMEDDDCSQVTESLLQVTQTDVLEPLNDLADATKTDIYEDLTITKRRDVGTENKQNVMEDIEPWTKYTPHKFALPTSEMKDAKNKCAKTRRFDVGSGPCMTDRSEKTIMMIGETGTGKSTLVDGMVNFILGVNWSDSSRFTVVNLEEEEKENRISNQAISKTEWITCYTVPYKDGNRIPYTINIIDTLGWGDTRWLDKDQAIFEHIRELFVKKTPQGILIIDAVCFVIEAPDARLTAMQSYIVQSIMSLFGKDIQKNICLFITFADGIDPSVFAALDESKLPFGKRFTFNNAGLYAKNTDVDQFKLSKKIFDMEMASFRRFFEHLDTLHAKACRLPVTSRMNGVI